MASIEIINNKSIKVNVNNNDRWSLNVTDSNFMLETYNGIGSKEVNIKTFSNVGDLFGKIELFVNNKLCNNCDLVSINNGSNDFFYVIPTIINLNGKDDKRDAIIYSSDSEWKYEILNNNDRISCSKENNTLKITSLKNEIFYDLRIKVFSEKLNAYDYITVNQTYINDMTNGDVFTVSPKVLTFTKLDEEKSFNVVTSCESGYSVSNVSSPFKNVGNNKIKLISAQNDAEQNIEISSCGSSSTITLKYEKDISSTSYLWIDNEGVNNVSTSFTKTNDTDVLPNSLSYTLLSTSKVIVISKPSNVITSISALNNNKCTLTIYFSDTSDFNGDISLRNYDNNNANISLSINGYGDENGIVFNFGIDENGKEITRINMESSENDIYISNFFSYHKKDKSLLKYKVYTNDFTITSSVTNFNGSANANVTLKPKDGVQGTKTIQLEEIETYKRLYITIPLGFNTKYYKFSFKDDDGFQFSDWYVVYDENGELMSDSLSLPTDENIISISSETLSFSDTNNTSYSPSAFTKTSVGIKDYLSGSENYYSSFTMTQDGSNYKITLHVTQIAAEACNEEYTYDNATLSVNGMPNELSKCNANLNNIVVTLNNVDILTNKCEEITSSITLSNSDYSITYIYNDTEYNSIPNNEDDYEKKWIIRIKTLLDGADFEEEYELTQEAGPCTPDESKTKITVTFSGTRTLLHLNGESSGYGCDTDNTNNEYELYLPESVITEYDISYSISGIDSIPSELYFEIQSQKYHFGFEDTGTTSYTPSSLSGEIDVPSCNDRESSEICKQIEQSCSPIFWDAYLSDDSKYELEVINNVRDVEPNTPNLVCNVPSGTFDGSDGFRIDFTSAVTTTVDVEVKIKDTNCDVVDTIEITVNKGQRTGSIDGNENIGNVTTQASQYFEITDVSPSADTTYIYWGGDCDYDDSNDCTPKMIVTKIKIRNNCNGYANIEYTNPNGIKTNLTLEGKSGEEYRIVTSGSSDFQVSIPYGNYENNLENSIYIEFFDNVNTPIDITANGNFAQDGKGFNILPKIDGGAGGGTVCTSDAKYQVCGTIIFVTE